MTRKTRRILFGLAVLAFLILGLVVTAYARGYRWDFENKRLLLSGAVYVDTLQPEDAQIAINSKPAHKTTAALIKNLLPLRKYAVEVTKEGYQPWRKEFEISPGLVAGAENIVLFPQELKGEIVWPEAGTTDFSVSPDQKFIAVKINSSRLYIRGLADLTATATPITFSDKRKTLAVGLGKNSEGWSPDSKKLIAPRDIAGRRLWYVWDAENNTLTDLTALYEKQLVVKQASDSPLPVRFAAGKVAWFGNSENLLALIDGRLFNLDLKNETVTDLKLNDVADFDSFESRIIGLKKPDILILIDSAVENVSVLGTAKFAPQKILFSPRGDKVAYASDNALGVLWLKATAKQPLKKAGDEDVVYAGEGKISQVFWQRWGEHLIFLEDQKLKAVEIDARPPVNTAAWAENILGLDYLGDESKLYLLESGTIKAVGGEF